MKKLFIFISIIFVQFYPCFLYAKNVQILCAPQIEEYFYDERRELEKTLIQPTEDLLITINEKKIVINYDNADVEYIRSRINADPTSFIMRFNNKKYPENEYIIFYRKSGRLSFWSEYDVKRRLSLRVYNCSKFDEPIF